MAKFVVRVTNGNTVDFLKKGGHGLDENVAYVFKSEDECEAACDYAEEKGVYFPDEGQEAEFIEVG